MTGDRVSSPKSASLIRILDSGVCVEPGRERRFRSAFDGLVSARLGVRDRWVSPTRGIV